MNFFILHLNLVFSLVFFMNQMSAVATDPVVENPAAARISLLGPLDGQVGNAISMIGFANALQKSRIMTEGADGETIEKWYYKNEIIQILIEITKNMNPLNGLDISNVYEIKYGMESVAMADTSAVTQGGKEIRSSKPSHVATMISFKDNQDIKEILLSIQNSSSTCKQYFAERTIIDLKGNVRKGDQKSIEQTSVISGDPGFYLLRRNNPSVFIEGELDSGVYSTFKNTDIGKIIKKLLLQRNHQTP